jgi:mannose-1-phosphate guanylyltransferase
MTQRRITPVILSGGSGTRLWPLSVPDRPKQLLALAGEQTMLQATAARVADRARFAAPVIVGSERHAAQIEEQIAAAGLSCGTLILEPAARNTAPAIALAALAADPGDLLLVMPSDHLIRRPEPFLDAVFAASQWAAEDWLFTFGIRPDRPETGFGYIQRGEQIGSGVFQAAAFVEKPALARAEAYVASGSYDWNAGIFLFRAGAYLAQLGRFEPRILGAASAAMGKARRDGRLLYPAAEEFAASPSRSIDHAVMEKASRIAVTPVDIGWSDVGSWDALFEIGTAGGEHASGSGQVVAIDAENCLLRADGITLAAVGVQDLVIIATQEAVLVIPRGQTQRVREAVEMLEKRRP